MLCSRQSQVLMICVILVSLGCGAPDTYNQAYTRGANIKSMIAITNVAIALENYRLDRGEYPPTESMGQLYAVLKGYLGEERGVDRWGQALIVTVTPESYALSSKGDDQEGGHERGGAVENAGHSITLENGVFVQYHSSVTSTARKYEAQIAEARSAVQDDA